MAAILADAIMSAKRFPGRRISYSRRKAWCGMGLKLQFVDSQMCCEILQKLSVKKGWSELCAPIDSLIAALTGRLLSSERVAPTQTFN